MSKGELLQEIERQRFKLYLLADSGADYNELLQLSQEIDKLIVMYYKAAA